MYNANNRNLDACAIIKVEGNSNYYFKVKTEDIMDASLLIKNMLDEYSVPYSRIYLTGFSLVTNSEISSLEKLSDLVSRIANEKSMLEETNKVSKR